MDYNDYLELRKSGRKNQVIITAAQLFLEHGIVAVTMTEIAEECGIGVATLYRYFNTKKNLVIEVAIYLWNDLEPLFCDYMLSDEFENANGYEQLLFMGKIFKNLFMNHRDFLEFIHNFDAYVLSEKIPVEELDAYEKSTFSFYKYFYMAVFKGVKDQSIRSDFDAKKFYLTVTHSLLALCQKLSSPGIIDLDNKACGAEQIEMLIDILISYIKK